MCVNKIFPLPNFISRLAPSCGIYVEIAPAAGDASIDIGTVVPEIQHKHRATVPDGENLFSEVISF